MARHGFLCFTAPLLQGAPVLKCRHSISFGPLLRHSQTSSLSNQTKHCVMSVATKIRRSFMKAIQLLDPELSAGMVPQPLVDDGPHGLPTDLNHGGILTSMAVAGVFASMGVNLGGSAPKLRRARQGALDWLFIHGACTRIEAVPCSQEDLYRLKALGAVDVQHTQQSNHDTAMNMAQKCGPAELQWAAGEAFNVMYSLRMLRAGEVEGGEPLILSLGAAWAVVADEVRSLSSQDMLVLDKVEDTPAPLNAPNPTRRQLMATFYATTRARAQAVLRDKALERMTPKDMAGKCIKAMEDVAQCVRFAGLKHQTVKRSELPPAEGAAGQPFQDKTKTATGDGGSTNRTWKVPVRVISNQKATLLVRHGKEEAEVPLARILQMGDGVYAPLLPPAPSPVLRMSLELLSAVAWGFAGAARHQMAGKGKAALRRLLAHGVGCTNTSGRQSEADRKAVVTLLSTAALPLPPYTIQVPEKLAQGLYGDGLMITFMPVCSPATQAVVREDLATLATLAEAAGLEHTIHVDTKTVASAQATGSDFTSRLTRHAEPWCSTRLLRRIKPSAMRGGKDKNARQAPLHVTCIRQRGGSSKERDMLAFTKLVRAVDAKTGASFSKRVYSGLMAWRGESLQYAPAQKEVEVKLT